MISYSELISNQLPDVKISGIWTSVGKTRTEYGWKLHISSIQKEAVKLLETILPILIKYEVSFKVANNSDVLGQLNEGGFGGTQVGKFVTIYPEFEDKKLENLTKELISSTLNFHGPKIVSDGYLGGTVYYRYGTFSPQIIRDRIGNIAYKNPNPDADYKVPFLAPPHIHNPFATFTQKAKIPEINSKLADGKYLILGTLAVRPKGTIFKALDLSIQEKTKLVVLKEGRRHCVSDSEGRDMWDRLKHQKEVIDSLNNDLPIPRAGDLFTYMDNLYLPIDYIEGVDYENRQQKPFGFLTTNEKKNLISEFIQLGGTIKTLHDVGIIHRDISPRNVRVNSSGRVFLLDFELSFVLEKKDQTVFAQGTPGYVSPQQKLNHAPSFGDDIYSFGSLLMMMLTGIDSQKVISNTYSLKTRLTGLAKCPIELSELICDCLSEISEQRPTMQQVLTRLKLIHDEIDFNTTDVYTNNITSEIVFDDSFIENGLKWLNGADAIESRSKLWYSPDIESSKLENTSNIVPEFALYRSCSRGVSGVIYTIAKLNQLGYSCDILKPRIEAAVDWLLSHEQTADDQMPGLHFGEAGVAVAITELICAGIIDSGIWFDEYIHEALNGPLDWPDLTHGAAGQGLAALICYEKLNDKRLLHYAKKCVDYLLEQQTGAGNWILPTGVPGLEGTSYTGFAHGTAGIVFFLCKYYQRSGAISVKNAAAKAGEWLKETSRFSSDRNVTWWPLHPLTDQAWGWWCHGGPGIAVSFLSLYEVTNDNSYSEIAKSALCVHPPYVRYHNLSQCHGLSGLGEIYLEAYRVLGEIDWYYKAIEIGNLLYYLGRNEKNGVTWLVENSYKPTADLMIGSSGILHFLARLKHINNGDVKMPLAI